MAVGAEKPTTGRHLNPPVFSHQTFGTNPWKGVADMVYISKLALKSYIRVADTRLAALDLLILESSPRESFDD